MKKISREEVIDLYKRFAAEGEDADDYLRAHYEHLLLSLKRLGQSFGPTGNVMPWDRPSSIAATPFLRVDPSR
jgi:hypothetical protein